MDQKTVGMSMKRHGFQIATRQLVSQMVQSQSFFSRNQFLIYRLFSLSGLVPVGAFLVVHLLTNASVLAGAGTFQSRVDTIHSLGPLLVPIEWAFIFLPMLFHASVGFVIIAGGLPNVSSYSYVGNVRYTLQRASAMIAFAFIVWHLIQLHSLGAPLGGGAFDPHRATSSAAVALQPTLVVIFYAIGILSVVFHFSNGLWTLGITWGIWTSPAAMRRANWVSIAIGIVLGGAGLGALGGMRTIDIEQAKAIENRMEEVKRMLDSQQPPASEISPVSTTGI
ncbi:MAG: succinate dehydrogenase [Planctomycetia bacterium]|nr:succinate dehydrogenase [Planctomycetia bacterium]RLT13123.1 MAG: succinate dehydrogenase [Planctomycetota bacterium]